VARWDEACYGGRRRPVLREPVPDILKAGEAVYSVRVERSPGVFAWRNFGLTKLPFCRQMVADLEMGTRAALG
jgi:hypothetical protein